MDESDCICRKCQKKVGYLQSGLCNGCINKVSFMDYWELKTPEEAVRLFIVQDLNQEISNGNEKIIQKLKSDMINGRIDECPKEFEEMLKENNEWEPLLKRVQQVFIKEEKTKEKNPMLEDLENQYEITDEVITVSKSKIYEFVCQVAWELGVKYSDEEIKQICEDQYYDFDFKGQIKKVQKGK